MNKSIIKTTDKEILPKNKPLVVNGVSINKSVGNGRKLRVTKASAIMTTTPIEAVEMGVNLLKVAPLFIPFLKSLLEKKKQQQGDSYNPESNIEVSGNNNNIQPQIIHQIINYNNCTFHNSDHDKKS